MAGKVSSPGPVELIERYSVLVKDPVERLKYLRLCWRVMAEPEERAARGRGPRRWRWRALTLESLWLASPGGVVGLGRVDLLVLWVYRHRRKLHAGLGATVVCTLLVSLAGKQGVEFSPRPVPGPAPARQATAPGLRPGPVPEVWMVETNALSELYSNGLRVLNDFLSPQGPQGRERGPRPVGIVYHTTESDLAPLESRHRQRIRQQGRDLLAYVRRERLYHFVIDRFGRVYRIVAEGENASHAGHSIWAEGQEVYFNLNHGFLGVALEARTATREASGGTSDITPSQLYGARLLTQMLRGRLGIADGNCVSHDLVSVNPERMLIGHHTDWAGGFPYRALDLSNKYERPLPSITKFGFRYDAAFVRDVGGKLWPGISLAEEQVRRRAAEAGLPVSRYRFRLQEGYRQRVHRLRAAGAQGQTEAAFGNLLGKRDSPAGDRE